ncbi:MAG: cold-shock protein [Rhodobacterales bacterium]|nr:MAG: cold-shock protein [Rhodobacterales bacterium]
MNQENGQQKRVTGVVKWFDPGKGFGFVLADDGGPDILLHINVLRNFGQSSIADQAVVDILVQENERGLQTSQILSISPPATVHDAQQSDFQEFDPQEVGEIQPARVKWFDKGKGFGFVNVFGSAEDVFVHVEVLRRSGLAGLQPGEAICVRIVHGQRGLMAAQVLPWDASFQGGQ